MLPPRESARDRIESVHRLMTAARRGGLDFVPAVFPAGSGTTVEHDGRLWDLTSWMPGSADFREKPTRARIEAACAALARVHIAWGPAFHESGPCQGLLRRLDRAREWEERSGTRRRVAARDGESRCNTRSVGRSRSGSSSR